MENLATQNPLDHSDWGYGKTIAYLDQLPVPFGNRVDIVRILVGITILVVGAPLDYVLEGPRDNLCDWKRWFVAQNGILLVNGKCLNAWNLELQSTLSFCSSDFLVTSWVTETGNRSKSFRGACAWKSERARLTSICRLIVGDSVVIEECALRLSPSEESRVRRGMVGRRAEIIVDDWMSPPSSEAVNDTTFFN